MTESKIWAVKSAGTSKAIALYETNKLTIDRATIVQNQKTEPFVHGENGQNQRMVGMDVILSQRKGGL